MNTSDMMEVDVSVWDGILPPYESILWQIELNWLTTLAGRSVKVLWVGFLWIIVVLLGTPAFVVQVVAIVLGIFLFDTVFRTAFDFLANTTRLYAVTPSLAAIRRTGRKPYHSTIALSKCSPQPDLGTIRFFESGARYFHGFGPHPHVKFRYLSPRQITDAMRAMGLIHPRRFRSMFRIGDGSPEKVSAALMEKGGYLDTGLANISAECAIVWRGHPVKPKLLVMRYSGPFVFASFFASAFLMGLIVALAAGSPQNARVFLFCMLLSFFLGLLTLYWSKWTRARTRYWLTAKAAFIERPAFLFLGKRYDIFRVQQNSPVELIPFAPYDVVVGREIELVQTRSGCFWIPKQVSFRDIAEGPTVCEMLNKIKAGAR